MKLDPRMANQPTPHGRRFVRRQIVQHEMDVQRRLDGRLNFAQQGDKVLRVMLGLTPRQDLARGDVERREEIERPVADVVVRPPLGLADIHGQHGLRAFERLNLRLLIDGEHHFDRYFQIEGEGSNQILPNVNGFQTTFGADRLGPGATMFIDDVITSGLGDPAAVPVTTSIDEAFDLEIEAFVKTAQSPADADRLIERAIDLLTAAEQQISLAGGFQSGSRTSDALMELSKAKKLDVEAREAIANNDPATANQALIDAATAKARAELFLEGHNPQPGPFPDGLGGFDAGDPIFADGFESGDVSAWSTGERRDTLDQPGCTPSSDTLCLGNEGRFRATVEWKDFSNNTGSRQVLDTSGDTGTFFFFNPGSPEVTVRLTDRCQYNNHFWVFYAGTTNVEYTLTVTDPNSDQTKSYFNPLGMPAAAITDTSAFATCP